MVLNAWRRLRREWLLLVLIAIILLVSLPVLTYPLGRDQGEFATIGRGLLNGKTPYVDLWNPKPPAVFYIYAAAMALFGQTVPALRAIDFLIAPFILTVVYWLGKRLHSRRAGLWSALLFGVFYFTETFWTLTQNDGIALLPMTLAMVCGIKAADGGRRSWLWALGAGLLCGWTLWFKYPFALMGAGVALAYGLLRWHRLPRLKWLDAAAFVFGGAAAVGAGVVFMLGIGAWDALIESATVTSQYTALGFNWTDFSAALRTAVGFRWSHWGMLFGLAAVSIVIAFRQRWHANLLPVQTRSENALIPIIWLEIGILIMLAQAKGYDYHWLPMLPPLALLGGIGIERILDAFIEPPGRQERQDADVGAQHEHAAPLPSKTAANLADVKTSRALVPAALHRAASALAAVGLLAILIGSVWSRALPYLTGQEDQIAYYHHFQAGEFVADESQLMANFLRERVSPGDSLYIWGFRPEVYYLSRLNPPTRFIFQFPLVADWYPPEWREENVEILWAAVPPYVLVLQVDYMPWVTGSHDDSNMLLQSYDDLNDWLIYNYERETMIGNFIIWRRKF